MLNDRYYGLCMQLCGAFMRQAAPLFIFLVADSPSIPNHNAAIPYL